MSHEFIATHATHIVQEYVDGVNMVVLRTSMVYSFIHQASNRHAAKVTYL